MKVYSWTRTIRGDYSLSKKISRHCPFKSIIVLYIKMCCRTCLTSWKTQSWWKRQEATLIIYNFMLLYPNVSTTWPSNFRSLNYCNKFKNTGCPTMKICLFYFIYFIYLIIYWHQKTSQLKNEKPVSASSRRLNHCMSLNGVSPLFGTDWPYAGVGKVGL